MATHRVLRVLHNAFVAPNARLLTLELEGGGDLAFVGGQYVIVNTGVTLPGGRLAKRAYSFVSEDASPATVQILVRPMEEGAGSPALAAANVGATFEFSGPWGKLAPSDDAPRERFVVATDTGITAALGLLRSRRAEPFVGTTHLLWLRPGEGYFAARAFVEARLPTALASVTIADAPAVDTKDRAAAVTPSIVGAILARGSRLVLAAGDGALLEPLRQGLLERGFGEDHVRVEPFFNNAARKAPSATAGAQTVTAST